MMSAQNICKYYSSHFNIWMNTSHQHILAQGLFQIDSKTCSSVWTICRTNSWGSGASSCRHAGGCTNCSDMEPGWQLAPDITRRLTSLWQPPAPPPPPLCIAPRFCDTDTLPLTHHGSGHRCLVLSLNAPINKFRCEWLPTSICSRKKLSAAILTPKPSDVFKSKLLYIQPSILWLFSIEGLWYKTSHCVIQCLR